MLEPPKKFQKLLVPSPLPKRGFSTGPEWGAGVGGGARQSFPFMGQCVRVFSQSTEMYQHLLCALCCTGLGTQRWMGHCVCLPETWMTHVPGGAGHALGGGGEGTDSVLLVLPPRGPGTASLLLK